ncbi:MAG TPA: Holliday junction resolvase RuvX [Ktedonobacteraceae bacterium]|nr:Holliday junction resolvase RuvX [Ktedonobacteraceae bacterium]
MTRYMALDVGEARIGVAVSDFSGFLASPYTTIHVSRSRSETRTFEEIQRLIAETEAEALVVGLPISLDGRLHAQGERIQAFAERLKRHISIPLTFWDERLSTAEATRLLTERGQDESGRHRHGGRAGPISSGKSGKGGQGQRAKRRQKGQEIDALAATVILQEYLDHQGHPGHPGVTEET